jgi:hypothetical protein
VPEEAEVALRHCRPCSRRFTEAEAEKVARKLRVNLRRTPLSEWTAGMNDEREHGRSTTCCDPTMTGKIARDHVRKHPRYYRGKG